MAYLYIYRNLRTGGFSVRHKGRVIDHISHAVALDVRFKVNPAGRERVLREGHKQVHAFVVAAGLAPNSTRSSDGLREVKYNPFTQTCFTVDGAPIERANAVLFKDGRCYLLRQ
jgi:hypothetical protein